MGLAFDAWGKRMQPNGTADPDGQLNPASTDRGFTGHEHLDELGFVHMNGRIDDPLLGRFLSPDPHIQDEGLLQNYNRYSYVLNNSLRYTDPSGEVWFETVAFIVGAALASSNNRDLKVIGTIMMMAALATVNGEPGLLQMLAGKDVVVPATVSAFGSAAIANTIAYGPEAGLKAGAFAAAFAFVGANIPGAMSPERIIAHAVLGCVQQASSGGQCGPGAAAAAFGKIATGLTQGLGEAAQFAVTTVVGGTVSVIGGGKFANGAAQAGFGYLFNHLGSSPEDSLTPASGPGLRVTLDDVSNFAAGVGDTLSLGGTAKVRDWLDIGSVDSNSTAYGAGEVTGVGIGAATGAAGLRAVAGPMKQWVRLGPSYSKAGGFHVDMSVRWGASAAGGGKYIHQMPSTTLQNFNQWLRSLKVPFGGWRGADPGHFHLWR